MLCAHRKGVYSDVMTYRAVYRIQLKKINTQYQSHTTYLFGQLVVYRTMFSRGIRSKSKVSLTFSLLRDLFVCVT